MIERHGYPVLTLDTLESFTLAHEHSVLFFTENPAKFPESNDVAMILPELVSAFAGILSAAVVDKQDQGKLQMRFGFREWPALVFLRRGDYLGAITRVQDWSFYLEEIRRILSSEATTPPPFNIPVAGETDNCCH
jgi:hydrogenase-1 operon protein HyaE